MKVSLVPTNPTPPQRLFQHSRASDSRKLYAVGIGHRSPQAAQTQLAWGRHPETLFSRVQTPTCLSDGQVHISAIWGHSLDRGQLSGSHNVQGGVLRKEPLQGGAVQGRACWVGGCGEFRQGL